MYIGTQELIIIFVFLSFFIIIPIIICAKRAEKTNRDKIVWGILAFLFGYFTVLILYLVSDDTKKKQTHTTLCPYCGDEIFVLAKKCKHCGEWIERK